MVIESNPCFLKSFAEPVFSGSTCCLIFTSNTNICNLAIFRSSTIPLQCFHRNFLSHCSSRTKIIVIDTACHFCLLSHNHNRNL